MDDPMVADVAREAAQRLDQVKGALTRLGLRFADLQPTHFGVGVGVAWGETDFLVLSVAAGMPNSISIAGGVLRDIGQDRQGALELCNSRVGDNPAYPVYLHDAEEGWDLILQQSYPIQLLLDVPPFFSACLEPTVRVVSAVRQDAIERGLAGTPYRWDSADAQRLLLRSLL